MFKTITVKSNDPDKPEYVINLTADIEAPMHASFDIGDDLFAGKCKSCHYDRAGKKKGGPLYLAICAFCHGQFGEGHQGSGPPINGNMPEKSLRYWVEKGKKGTAMPGYAKERGGPLSSEQVDSLITFMQQRFQ